VVPAHDPQAGGVTEISARRRLPAADRRAEISVAARSLFARNGYHATTTRQLAAAAGVSDALLYRHFADKHAVLTHVVDEALSTFGSLPPLERMAPLPTDQLLQRLGGEFLKRVTANLDLVEILIAEHAVIQDVRFATFIDGAATALGNDLVRRGVRLDPDTGYLAARSFFGSLISFVLLQRVLGMDAVHPIEPHVYLDDLVAHTVRS
jgi:AcrR family transcriptional regulator